jgi:DMSO/TMAO reductase YedYZ molybdopterin-dependent catalytic subunit
MPTPSATPETPVETSPQETDAQIDIECRLTPIVVPTLPAEIPGYTELDPSTGLHMTGTYAPVDLENYRLEVTGKVDNPLSLSYDQLRCLPRVEQTCNLVCLGFFEDRATWAGASLDAVLELAGVQPEASYIRLVGGDGYRLSVPLELARSEQNFLAYEWEGEPLPLLHGFPVRVVFPDMLGNHWVKWLVQIDVY